MQDTIPTNTSFDCAQLKRLQQGRFPENVRVQTDKPNGLVSYEEGLVSFQNTNVFLRAYKSRQDTQPHLAPLCVRFVCGGQETYTIDKERVVMDDSAYLVHNSGQTVCSSVDTVSPVESFTIGFWPGFAEDILRSLITPDDHLLDAPDPSCPQPLHFFDQRYPHDAVVSPLLWQLRDAMDDPCLTPGWLEEQHCQLLTALLYAHRDISKQIARLPAVRAVTRIELYRRLHRARDFMEAGLDQPLTIERIAQEAWFSPFHFLRQFKEAFGETPHQYLTRRRLERAQHLLKTTEMPVTDVCFAVGFESLGSFSNLFRQRVGASPQKFRFQDHCAHSLKSSFENQRERSLRQLT